MPRSGSKTSSIFVVGPEGSGTTLLWRCLAAHPGLRSMRAAVAPPRRRRVAAAGVLVHVSLPTLRPMLWVEPEDIPGGAKVVVVWRSPVHTVYSAYRRFHDDPAVAWRTYFRAVRLEERYIAIHHPWAVQYEALIADPAGVLRRLYEWVGVRGDFLPKIRIHARNDERWRDDLAFAAFMRDAFGDSEAGAADLCGEPKRDKPAQPGRLADANVAHAAVRSTERRGRDRGRMHAPAPASRPKGAHREAGSEPASREALARRGRSVGHGPPRLVPAQYVRIDDFLTPPEHARLLEYARAREADFAAAGVISGDDLSPVDTECRRRSTISDLDGLWEMFDGRLRRLLPYLRRELDLAWFPLDRLEREMTVYGEGGVTRLHPDSTDAAVAGRCITCVYCFHGHPKRFTGGELQLYDTVMRGGRRTRASKCVRVDPPANTAIFFASDLYYAIGPVHRASTAFADRRFAIHVWFRMLEQPAPSARDVSLPIVGGRTPQG